MAVTLKKDAIIVSAPYQCPTYEDLYKMQVGLINLLQMRDADNIIHDGELWSTLHLLQSLLIEPEDIEALK
jgi:hypothetical protein